MAVQVAPPLSLPSMRTVGASVTLAGALITFLSGFTGRAGIVGAVVLCAGIALLDGADRGGLGIRQVGLFLVLLGSGLGAWSFAVVALLMVIGLPVDDPVRALFVASTAAVVLGALMIRPPRPVLWLARLVVAAARMVAPPVRRAAVSGLRHAAAAARHAASATRRAADSTSPRRVGPAAG
jgi:hypothetical protein